MLLELMISLPKLDPSLFLHWISYIIPNTAKSGFVSAAPYESNWHLFKSSELKSLKSLKLFAQCKHQTPVSSPSSDAERELRIELPLQLL